MARVASIKPRPGKNPKRPGKTPKITRDAIKILVDARRLGMPLNTCAAYAQIHVDTLRDWMRRGEDEREAGRSTLFSQLAVALDKAESERVAESLLRIRQAAKGDAVAERVTVTTTAPDGRVLSTVTRERTVPADWKADAWVLERMRPKDFSPTQRAEVTGKDGGPIGVASGTWADLLRAADADADGTGGEQ